MFFSYAAYERTNVALTLAPHTRVCAYDGFDSSFLQAFVLSHASEKKGARAVEQICIRRGIPSHIRRRIRELTDRPITEESYFLSLGRSVRVYANSDRAAVYAVATLSHLCDVGELSEGILFDTPIDDVRGYRVFLPPRAGFDRFMEILDLLAYYKFNAIMLEIGGAMEYRRHPEINEKWAEFCKDMHSRSGRCHEIQFHTYPWHKNAIHSDNAEGDVLTQDECRYLANACRARGLEVIPECPTLSHCDYLVMAHPEIRERAEDGHPDTYCPNHPDTYPLVFDILEEVIDVFAPKRMNIGHDELYTVGICPRCKGAPAPVLYANDVWTLRNFLKKRGVETMMWGEKLLKAYTNEGVPVGGTGHGKGYDHVPALYPCRDLMPSDVTFLHWYWPFNHTYDRVYHERNLNTVYGNINVMKSRYFDLRRSWGIHGGFVSNWGSFAVEYMQRNQQYLTLLSAAYAFWCPDFDARGKEAMMEHTFKEAFRLNVRSKRNPLYITHTTETEIPYVFFYDGVFIEREKYLLGEYELTYADGYTAKLPVIYGLNIGCKDYRDFLTEGGFGQLCYGVEAIRMGEGFAYRTVYENPYPQGELVSIRFVPCKEKNACVELLGYEQRKPLRGLFVHQNIIGEREFAMDGGTV